jgi:hypothetical protein
MKDYTLLTHIFQLFMMACSGIAAITGYLNRHKHYSLRIFYFYPLASCLQTAILYILVNTTFSIKITYNLIFSTINIFVIIEFLSIYHFFLQVLKTRTIKKVIFSIMLVFILTVPFYQIFINGFFSIPANLFFIVNFFLVIPALLYFFELFKWPPAGRLWELPSFWIATGIAFYFACTLPLFLMKDFIYRNNRSLKEQDIYLINFIAYGILFLFIAKAYLCPKRDTP